MHFLPLTMDPDPQDARDPGLQLDRRAFNQMNSKTKHIVYPVRKSSCLIIVCACVKTAISHGAVPEPKNKF